LLARNRKGFFVVSVQNEFGKFRGSRDICPLTDIDKVGVRANDQCFQSTQATEYRNSGESPGLEWPTRLGNGTDMRRRGPTASANDVQPTVRGIFPQGCSHLFR